MRMSLIADFTQSNFSRHHYFIIMNSHHYFVLDVHILSLKFLFVTKTNQGKVAFLPLQVFQSVSCLIMYLFQWSKARKPFIQGRVPKVKSSREKQAAGKTQLKSYSHSRGKSCFQRRFVKPVRVRPIRLMAPRNEEADAEWLMRQWMRMRMRWK